MTPRPDPQSLTRWCSLLLLALLAACSSAPDKRQLQYMNQEGFGKRYVGNAEEEDYISIGDQVIVSDVLNPELESLQIVRIDGMILLPEVNEVPVAGYTRRELEAVLTERYSLYYKETDIVVDIVSRGKSFWVLGEVAQPGRKEFLGNQVVFEAVMEAVPERSSANIGRVMLVRGDPRDPLVLMVNIEDIMHGLTATNYEIKENDIVIVPATLLAEFGYFLEALLFPVRQVISSIGGAFFGTYNNRNANDRRALTLGSVF